LLEKEMGFKEQVTPFSERRNNAEQLLKRTALIRESREKNKREKRTGLRITRAGVGFGSYYERADGEGYDAVLIADFHGDNGKERG